ncbi:MAG: hypothetical protein FJW35_01275 [Acidobacteria bacterium]|nr:hypothetical protein [Acidobacteriota bacterium]
MKHLLTICLLATVAMAQGQQPPKKFEFKVEKVNPRPPAEPEEGDKFEIDPSTGDLLIEYKDRNGKAAKVRIEKATKVKPEVTVSYQMVGPDLVRYKYTLENKPGAKQDIEMFSIATDNPGMLTNITTPIGWWASGPGRSGPGNPSRYNWWARVDTVREGLSTGKSAISFSFDAPALPGLGAVYVRGLEPIQFIEIDSISEWLSDRIYEARRFENNVVRPKTVGPRIGIQSQLPAEATLAAIGAELMAAMTDPEFEDIRAEILELRGSHFWNDVGRVGELRSAVSVKGRTPLQRQFFQAIAFGLDHVAARNKRP